MRPRGFSSATRLAGRSWRTTWQKTFCSRTRRAISWPYCEPKSKIKTRSLSGSDILAYRFFLVGKAGEQFFQGGFVVDVAIADEPLDLHLNLIAIIHKFNFPALARDVDLDHDRILAALSQGVSDLGLFQAAKQFEYVSVCVIHLSYSVEPSNFLIVLKPVLPRFAPA